MTCRVCELTIFIHSGLTVSLDQATYFVSEASGSLEVCAIITQGQLAPSRSAVVLVTTEDGSAGKLDWTDHTSSC